MVDNSNQSQHRHDLRGLREGGSKITVSNPSNPASDWSYVTLFDGVFRPVTGQQGAETAVEIINPKSIRIYNKRDGVVNQVVINTLSEDNNTISNEYIRMDKEGKITGVTHVTYIRRKVAARCDRCAEHGRGSTRRSCFGALSQSALATFALNLGRLPACFSGGGPS